MDYLKRGIRFFVRNLFRDPLYLIRYAIAYVQSDYACTVAFFTEDELDAELTKGKSLIRFGDGEIYMMNYGSIVWYQQYDPKLRDYLLQIRNEYNPNAPYLLSLAEDYVNLPNQELRAKHILRCYLPMKIMYRYFFPHNVKYFDTHLFYRSGFARVLEKHLTPYRIVFVTRKYNQDRLIESGITQKLNITFVETPDKESFTVHEDILTRIKEAVGEKKEEYRILLATGPASKVLAYKLAKEGYTAYDIGKGAEAIYSSQQY